MSCRTLRSRSGVPIWPRKYFETTMLVACCDHDFGISTSRCSNTTSPRSLPMTAERSSHSTSSNGSTPASVKNRGNVSPGAAFTFFARGLSLSTGIGACDVPLLSTVCWPAPAAFMAARSSICPQLPLLRRYRNKDKSSCSCVHESARQAFWISSAAGVRLLSGQKLGTLGSSPLNGLVARRGVNMRRTSPFVNTGSTRYCGSLLGRTQDVDSCVSLWT